MKIKKILSIFIISITTLVLTTCDAFGTIIGVINMAYSVQINNQTHERNRSVLSRSVSFGDDDIVELYISELMYQSDRQHGGLILISAGTTTGSWKKGNPIINNAGWYSIHTNLAVVNDVLWGLYSYFVISIGGLRINGI